MFLYDFILVNWYGAEVACGTIGRSHKKKKNLRTKKKKYNANFLF